MKGPSRVAEGPFRAGSVLVVQHPAGRVVKVVELPPLHRAEQEREEDPPDQQRQGDQQEVGAHASPCRTSRSTRAEFQMTSALETGISTAATSGFTSPKAAAPIETRL